MLKTAEPPPDLLSVRHRDALEAPIRWVRTGSSGDKGVPSGEGGNLDQFGGDDSKTDRTCIEKKQRWEAEASEAKV